MDEATLSKAILQGPILETAASILPKFKGQPLDDPEVREKIVEAIDLALVAKYPLLGSVDEDFRKRVIGEIMDFLLDTILIPLLP